MAELREEILAIMQITFSDPSDIELYDLEDIAERITDYINTNFISKGVSQEEWQATQV